MAVEVRGWGAATGEPGDWARVRVVKIHIPKRVSAIFLIAVWLLLKIRKKRRRRLPLAVYEKIIDFLFAAGRDDGGIRAGCVHQ